MPKFLKIKKYLVALAVIFLLLAGLNMTQAQTTDFGLNEASNIGLPNSGITDPKMLVINIVRIILGFLGIVATIVVLYGGWLWMTSNGDPSRVEKAKKTLIAAVIGIIIIISAFGIVSFIANLVQNTLTGGGSGGCSAPTPYSCTWGCSATPCGTITPTPDSFRLRSTSPRADAVRQPRNIIIRGFVSDQASTSVDAVLDNNFRVQRIGDVDPASGTFFDTADTPVAGVTSISASRVILDFRPNTNLDAWSRYEVNINGASGIVDVDGRPLQCGVPGTADCLFTFDTSDLIDIATPTAGIVPTQICRFNVGSTTPADANILGGWGRDDTGISNIRFYSNPPRTELYNIPGLGSRYQYEERQINTSVLTIGATYTFSIEADDLVGNTRDASFNAVIRVGHCCDGELNADEEEVDCGGSECDSCSSMNPIITNVSPDNGAPGNFITISGRFFGTTQGDVYFSDSVGGITIRADFPDPTRCLNNWQNNQIIVTVPAGAQSGPIRVVRADAREDTTAFDSPPQIDFTVNTIARPGLCLVNPDFGYFNDSFELHGNNFSGTNQSVRFGNETEYVTANNIHSWSNVSVRAQVPNVGRGRNTTYVTANNENSNPLYFNVLQDITNNPVIDYIDPPQGPNQQYITIYGSGFMSYQPGVSAVTFVDSGTLASTTADGSDFPVQCRDNWWHDRYITVKVPNGIAAGNYHVRVTNRATNMSNAESFVITVGSPRPGICLLDPNNGPTGTEVNIYGDNLGAAPGLVRFYNNVTPVAYNSWATQAINVNVPAGAVTGPVVVSNISTTSNSLPFRVGRCASTGDCESGEECCGSNSLWSGICRPTGTCAGTAYAPTSFGWTFSTDVSAGPGANCSNGSTCTGAFPACADPANYFCDPDAGCTCQPRTNLTDSCKGRAERTSSCASLACPNSPGLCSPYTAAPSVPLTGRTCDDSCGSVTNCAGSCTYDMGIDSCVLPGDCSATVQDVFNNPVTATCVEYEGVPHYQIVTNASCPDNTAGNDWVNIGNRRCVDRASTCTLCPSDFSCRSYGGGSQCIYNQKLCPGSAHCEGTQCMVGGEDSCECCCRYGGAVNYDAQDCCSPLTCGDSCGAGADSDGNNLGYCSGCALAGGTQDEHDAACNCEGHAGKFCATISPSGETIPEGICLDCASLDPSECSDHDACCVDAQASGVCRGVGDDGERYDDGGVQYCAYYNCDISGATATCVNNGSTGRYMTATACGLACLGPDSVPAGERCINTPYCTSGLPSCGIYFSCLTNNVGSDCRCCCDPSLINSCDGGLQCLPNKAPCDGNSRGLCCGCQADVECFGGDWQGCDGNTCCNSRPNIIDNYPLDETASTCRNTIITATFDQKMNISSFTGNVILLGDYNTDSCPAGTQFLAQETQYKSKYAKIFDSIKRSLRRIIAVVWPQQKVLAQWDPVVGHTYCAVRGVTTGYTNATDQDVLVFRPSVALDSDRTYFVVILGDRDLTDSAKQGVLSAVNVGMNGASLMNTFNGIPYNNAYIWAFRTGNDICQLDHVTVNPSSYLFNTLATSTQFTAEPRAANNQIINSIPAMYEWTWVWRADNTSVVTVTNDGSAIQTVTPQNVKDGRTVVSARADVTLNNFSSAPNQSRTGMANVYVFLCENPWPPRRADGTWSPWQDAAANCLPGSGNCANSYNYEMYYCRDSGKNGTYDDLPAILNDAVIRGSSSSTLKEAYFFRENMHTATTTLNVVNDGTGDSVTANWGAVTDPDLRRYRLYWGNSSGNYNNHLDTTDGTILSLQVTGLTRNAEYFFKLTGIYPNNVENELYEEATSTPRDTIPPAAPAGFTVATTTTSGELRLQWNPVSDAASYKVYYGVTAGTYGSSQNVGRVTTIVLAGFTVGNTYHIDVTAVDQSGNESGHSIEVIATP